jgi:hypothetical protein
MQRGILNDDRTSSFGAARPAQPSRYASSSVDQDKSCNHTLTVKYKDRSYLQTIGRIEGVASAKRQRSFDFIDDVSRDSQRVKVKEDQDSDAKGLIKGEEPLNKIDDSNTSE